MLLSTDQFSVQFSKDGTRLGFIRDESKVQLVEVAAAQEYRTLVSSLGAGQGEYRSGAIGPDGRLLAVGTGDGVRLWDLASGRELDFLPVGQTWSACFQADGRELLTSGESGIRRWPLRNQGEAPRGNPCRPTTGPPVARRSQPCRPQPGRSHPRCRK